MSKPNMNTITLVEIVRAAVRDGEYAIDKYAGFKELFQGTAPANVHATVPGIFHQGENGRRGKLKTVYDVVTQDPNFGENAKGLVRLAHQNQTQVKTKNAPGLTATQASKRLEGRLTPASQLPVPARTRARAARAARS